ncbi:MAG TPA: hypothetical protein VHW64_14585 [Nocardioides sp.]|uniref:hypothetical protein n=1 Tax=Nocardioides sp. TaxID=35761 RepID=UPI002E35E19A|nr:hypothetical protein [Nocardioides sp.]HEX3931928.1 hypothetical protein [Nocardioides sp.]
MAAVVLPGRPAEAAGCGSGGGVRVVVDFHQLSSKGPSTACDAGGGGDAASAIFAAAGHRLTFVVDEPFVCEVDGAPSTSCARTPPSDAYWSLWWSDGTSGTWKYAAVGVASLHVPDGGYVALSWQKGNAQVPPRVAPTSHNPGSPTSSPTTQPTSHPSSHPTRSPSSGPSTSTSSAPATPSDSPSSPSGGHTHLGGSTAKPPRHPSATPSATPSASPGASATGEAGGALPTGSSGGGSGSGGVPGWVAPVAVLLVFAAGGAVTLARRRARGGT